jgi:hypothetical protein
VSADLARWPIPRARLQLAHGRWLRRQRQIVEARAELRAARDAFGALGRTAWGDIFPKLGVSARGELHEALATRVRA